MTSVAREAHLLHALPGRLRVYLPAEAEYRPHQLEALRRLPGVTQVQDNPWTSNLLIHFDPRATDQQTLLTLLGAAESDPPEMPMASRQVQPLEAALVWSTARTACAALGLGLFTAWRLAGRSGPLPGVRGLAMAARLLTLLQSFAWVREGLRNLLGRSMADLLFQAADLLHSFLSSDPLSLALAGWETLQLLLEALAPPNTCLAPEQQLGLAA